VLGALPRPDVRTLVVHGCHGNAGHPLCEAVVDTRAIASDLVCGPCGLELFLQHRHVRRSIVHHARVQKHLGDHRRSAVAPHHPSIWADAGVVANHAQNALHPQNGHVHHTGSTETVANYGDLRRVHKVIRLHLVDGSTDFGHVQIRIPAMGGGSRHPVGHVLNRRAVAVDVGCEAHIAHLGQHPRALLLVVVHAVPVLNDDDCWALHAGSATRSVVGHVALAGGRVACVVVQSGGQHVVLRPAASSWEAIEQLHEEVLGALPRPDVRTLVVHGCHGNAGHPLCEAVVDTRAIASDLVCGPCGLELFLQHRHVRRSIVHHARVQKHLGDHRRSAVAPHHPSIWADAGVVANHAQNALHPQNGHVHHTGSTETVANYGDLRRVHKVIRLHLVDGSTDFGHVQIRIPAMGGGSRHPVGHVLNRRAVAVDVGCEAHIAHLGQHPRALLLVVVHAVPVLNDDDCWALHAGSAC